MKKLNLQVKKVNIENNFTEAWKRIRSETELKNQKDLAVLLRITPAAITDMKKTGKFPEKWAYLIESRIGLKSEWIISGNGPKKDKKSEAKRKFQFLNEVEEWLEEMIKKEPYREDWLRAEFEDKFPAFKAWKEEKDGKTEAETDFPASKVA